MLISAFLSLLQATSVLVSLIVLISFHGFQVDGKIDRFVLNVVENGTSVNEQIEVDVENQTEVIRAPQHNDAEAVEIMNDFTAGLSAQRIPATKDCYVSELDSSLPSPAKMKLDLEQASRQPLPTKVRTERTGWRVVGFADRLTLPKKIVDFCGSFPIFNVEPISLDAFNTTMVRDSGHGRRKRSHWISRWNGCDPSDASKMSACLNKHYHNFSKITLNCRYDTSFSFYLVSKCRASANWFHLGFKCDSILHQLNWPAVCCTPSC
ncbi:hypothetical protein ACROYT_G043715 [Oculina patagonica]